MKKISRKLLGVVLFLAAPMCLTSCFDDGSSSSNSESSNNNSSGSSERIYLTSVSISANRTSFVTGENIVITPSITPYNANYYDDSSYKESFFEHFYEKDGGEAVQYKKNSFAGSFTFEEPGNYVFWSKYCNHNFHSGTSGDLVSNRIEVSVDLPESEKVLFKYDTLADGTLSIYAGKLLSSVVDVVIPAKIDGKVVSHIKDKGFVGLPSIETLKFDKDLEDGFAIGKEAFSNCSKLRIVQFPWQVKKVGSKCFNNSKTTYLIEEQLVPDGFYANNWKTDDWNVNKGLVYCNIKDFCEQDDFLFGLDVVNEYEVIKYYGRDSEVTIPKTINDANVTKIRGYAFSENGVIKKVNIPETVVDIFNNSFEKCSLLSEIEFPEVCTAIGNFAFNGCKQLKYVYLPYSLVEVGKQCFKDCHPELIILSAQGSKPDGFYTNGWSDDAWNCGANLTFYNKLGFIHDGDFTYAITGDNAGLCVVEYKGRDSNLIIPNSVNSYPVKEIGHYCFYEKNFITSVTLPNSLVKIEEYGFSKCINLQTIKLPDTLNYIGKYGFYGCSSLKTIVIPKNVETIGTKTFGGCPNLEIYVVAASKPTGFFTNGWSDDAWNTGVKMTYWGAGNGWFYDGEGNPYHL